jgi:CBS domain-containing protein
MTRASAVRPAGQSPPALGTVADVVRPPLATVAPHDHAAAAAYLMKHADASALIVLDAQSGQPVGVITEANIAHAVARGEDVNDVRVHDLMTRPPAVITTITSIRDAASVMMRGSFRHLLVTGDGGLVGIVDIIDVCRVLIDRSLRTALSQRADPAALVETARQIPYSAPGNVAAIQR